MKITEYIANLLMESDGATVKEFISRNGGSTIGKVYLTKGPNGKPFLYRYDKIVKNSSIVYFGTMEFGKIVNDREFYISWSKLSSTNKISPGSLDVITNADAARLLADIGVTGKIPETPGINAKPLPAYEVRR